MAIPISVGSLVLLLYAGGLLIARPLRSILYGGIGALVFAAIGLLITTAFSGRQGLQASIVAFIVVLLVLLILGMPVGFCFAISTLGVVYGLGGVLPLEGVARRFSESGSSFVLSAVPFFIAAGLIMESGDITRKIIAVANSFLRHVRGHVGHVTIGSMYFMSGVTGSESADVAAVGAVMRRPMLETGFKPGESTGILVASSVMGATVPPSIGLIIIAAAAEQSVSALFLAGFLPAALLAIALSATVYFRARAMGMQGAPKATWRARGLSIRNALLAMGLPLIVIVGMVAGLGTPTELSAIALLYVIAIEVVVHRAVSLKTLYRVAIDAAVMTGMLLFIVAAASSLVYVSTLATLPQRVGQFLTDVSGSTQAVFLVLTILALIPLGMLMEGIAALLVFPPLLVPAAVALGINPIHYSILVFLAVMIGANLPPIGAGFYFASAVMEADIKRSMGPSFFYLGIVTIGLLVIAFVPAVTLIVPQLLGVD
jgi:tripartite ATP-independent transporter DctM subunit